METSLLRYPWQPKPNFQNFKNIILPVYEECFWAKHCQILPGLKEGKLVKQVHPEPQYFMGGIFWTVQWAKTPVCCRLLISSFLLLCQALVVKLSVSSYGFYRPIGIGHIKWEARPYKAIILATLIVWQRFCPGGGSSLIFVRGSANTVYEPIPFLLRNSRKRHPFSCIFLGENTLLFLKILPKCTLF